MSVPDSLVAGVRADMRKCRLLAGEAVRLARQWAPRLHGDAMAGITGLYGDNLFGLTWEHDYLWFQEAGTNPFTMRSLAGKVIPMWIDDPDGSLAAEEEASGTRVRVTAMGRRQTLIFRRAAKMGERKLAMRRGRLTDVPRSWPGAPGRITPPRADRGHIRQDNVGVRWRHPGLEEGGFLRRAITTAAEDQGLRADPVPIRLDA